MSRPFSPDEPARKPDYRKLYIRIKRWREEVDDTISHLYKMINELRDRVNFLEGKDKDRTP